MKKNAKILFSALLTMLAVGCVEPYLQEFSISNKIIIVEGLLANDIGLSPILIKESSPSVGGGSNIIPIIGAKVSVLIDAKTTIQLTEKEEGKYAFDSNFKGEIGSTYQLKFTTSDGNSFESKIEKLEGVNPIDKVYHILDSKALVDAKGKTSPGYKLYLDMNDPAGKENQYLWQWTLYEKQNVCQTCTGGYYYTTPAPYGSCVRDAILARYGNIFDYACRGNCWEIVRSSELITNNDQLYDGKKITGQLVGKIPIYQNIGALLAVSQFAISKDAYKFIKLTQQQGIETGGLADTPPAALIGNISCVNKSSVNTSGYFIVSGKSTFSYFLDRKDVLEQRILPIGLLDGRAARYEPTGADPSRPPYAPCVNSANRTNQEPSGWIN